MDGGPSSSSPERRQGAAAVGSGEGAAAAAVTTTTTTAAMTTTTTTADVSSVDAEFRTLTVTSSAAEVTREERGEERGTVTSSTAGAADGDGGKTVTFESSTAAAAATPPNADGAGTARAPGTALHRSPVGPADSSPDRPRHPPGRTLSAPVLPSAPAGEAEGDRVRLDFARRCTLVRYDDGDVSHRAASMYSPVRVRARGNGGPFRSPPSGSAGNGGRKKASSSTSSTPTPGGGSSSSTTPQRQGRGRGRQQQEPPRMPVPTTSWSPIDGSMFDLRTGPNYGRNKTKAPSLPHLYETVAVRCFRSDSITRDVVEVLPLPLKTAFGPHHPSEEEDIFDGDEGSVGSHGEDVDWDEEVVRPGEMEEASVPPDVPELLVVHFPLPYEVPNVFRPREDGTGGEIVFYLRPTRRFVDEVTGKAPMTPATNLFVKWCRRCDVDADLRSRFKVMAVVHDLDVLNLGWVKPYNGKPVLITESGGVRKGVAGGGIRYLEMMASVHKWGFLAKKSFVSLIPRLRDMRINVGFTIEATQDHEMPECILGSACMNFVDESTLETIPPSIQRREGQGGPGGGKGRGGSNRRK